MMCSLEITQLAWRVTAMRKFALGCSMTAFYTAVFLLSAVSLQAESHLTATSHVPSTVANGQARLVSHLPASQRLNIAISLPLRNESGLDELLGEIYDPQSVNYHHYLSVPEFTERFSPTSDDYASVISFARTNGLRVMNTSANHLVVDLSGPVANIEKAFHVSMGVYQHPTQNRTFYSPDREPSLDLSIPVQHISGLDNFALPRPKNVLHNGKQSGKTTGSGPGGQFVASDMRAAYYGAGPLTGKGQSVALFEYAGYEISDVQTYFKNLNQKLNVPVKGVSLNGVPLNCPPATCDDSEQAIDIEMAIGMAPALSQVVVYVGSNDVSIFNQIAVDNTSKTSSCSWGWPDDETSLDPIFKEMAAQGQSVFVATGDQGSATQGDVVWPGDDPYITAVGGTDLTTQGAGGPWASETGWSGSAGMPSKNKIPIPAYQKLKGVINGMNHGSTTLRNIPDVAAESNTDQYSCYDGECGGGNGGTSFAAPQWASFIAMVNQQYVADGKPTVGFINPELYRIGISTQYGNYFHDILSGNNGGYSDVVGYDLVTGWGSPTGFFKVIAP
jgi:subtilase family serine protease